MNVILLRIRIAYIWFVTIVKNAQRNSGLSKSENKYEKWMFIDTGIKI